MNNEYFQIGKRMAITLGNPTISGLYLPAPVPDETFRDEFGFVLQSDGSVGPFYVSMGDILQTLWTRFPQPQDYGGNSRDLLQGFLERDLATRALAVGGYNALSASLIRASGYTPPNRAPKSGLDDTPPGSRVGMVGYFCPLVDKLIEQGCEVLILEQCPERVAPRVDVSVTREPHDLQDCQWVLCTASTLINDTLEELLATVSVDTRFELIGPSGSGLPDPLFTRGVASVGGISFADNRRLLERLNRGESWGDAGRKYQLSAASYPGIDYLEEMARAALE